MRFEIGETVIIDLRCWKNEHNYYGISKTMIEQAGVRQTIREINDGSAYLSNFPFIFPISCLMKSKNNIAVNYFLK